MAKKKATKKAKTLKKKKVATKKTATKKVATKKVAAKKATKKSVVTATKSKSPKTVKKSSTVKTPVTKISVKGIALGETVPGFSLQATGNKTVSLEALKGKFVVLYFYPKDATPGCTIEGHEFTKLHEQFKGINTEVFGVSRDTLGSHEKFKEKECYSIDLLSDEDEKLCNTFGVIREKNMYGKKVMGIERSTFIIDTDGKLVKEWRGVSVPGHAEEVLNFLKTLPAGN